MTRADVPVPLVRSGEVASRTAIRRANLGLVLRYLNTHGPRSRSQLADDLSLPKATVSTLISELVELELLSQQEPTRAGAIGRPRQAVELRGGSICGLGVEVSADSARAIALDPRDDVLLDREAALAGGLEEVLDSVAALISAALDELDAAGTRVLQITIAAPGQLDREAGVVLFAAVMGWSDLPLVRGLTERLGRNVPPIRLDNDARLGAVAEHAACRAENIHDLLYVTGGIGVGAGILVNGQILRGALGFAGEIGHLPLGRADHPCPCGRSGCLEAAVGLTAFLDLATDADDPVRSGGRVEDRMAEIHARARAGDDRVLTALDTVAEQLGVGVSMLIDVLSPRTVVLGGYFAYFGDHLLDRVRAIVDQRAIARQAGGCDIRASSFGFSGPARGAAHDALEGLFLDPVAVLPAR